LGTCILPFGLLGSKKKISETTEFLLKYATFWDFSHYSVRTKKLHKIKLNFFLKNS
jgi:hypothetical protein